MAFPPVTRLINRLAGYVPLVYLGDKIVLSNLNRIYISDLRLKNIEYICSIGKLTGIWRILSRFRLMQRLLRLDIGPAIPLQEEGFFLVFYRKQAFRVDIYRRVALLESMPRLSRAPLQLLLIKSGSQKGVVLFGDYCSNATYSPVNIYRRNKDARWEIAYVFPRNEINHVHGIFEDEYSNCFYILTGDFDQGACIWKADMHFKDVHPMIRQGQMSRACWIISMEGSLVFATDRQDEFNYLCTINDRGTNSITRKFPIAGSSIFFSSTHSSPIVFSTAVEPQPSGKLTLRSLFSMRRARGILSDNACIYIGSPERSFEIVFSGKKDCMPFGLFQFGNIRFPAGSSSENKYVHFYCSALRGHDGVMYVMQLGQS
jgi:hypothetical protein